jgi:hypothetical protein
MTNTHHRSRRLQEDQDQHRSLQDDRAALEVDAEDGSPLVTGEGAPLADDGVTTEAQPNTATPGPPLFIGGMPVFRG